MHGGTISGDNRGGSVDDLGTAERILKRFSISYCGAPLRAVEIPHRLAMNTEVGGNFDSQAEGRTITPVVGRPTEWFGVSGLGGSRTGGSAFGPEDAVRHVAQAG